MTAETINTARIAKHLSAMTCSLLMLLFLQPVQAGLILDTPILGGSLLVASDGNVHAGFLGSDAGYYNTLFLDSPDDFGTTELFNKYSPLDGSLIDLGFYKTGTELIFRLDVHNTQLSFFTGAANRNPDDLAHAMATTSILDGLYVTTVSFEDLLGGGDLDYNDFTFVLTNVLDPAPVPEPSALLLLSLGLCTMGASRLRRRRKA
jgi:hypothetical protein